MDLGLSGLASGFDWRSLIDQLLEVERTPQRRLLNEQNTLQQKNNAFASIVTQLKVLQTRVDALKEASLFNTRKTTVADTTIASASATDSAAAGTYTFNITQLATASARNGTSDAGQKLSATNDVSGLVLDNAAFNTTITAGIFTVNGQQVTIATSDTLQQVFDKISTATGGSVTASYDSATDKITLSSGSEIILGSATDTSNFLQASKLTNNGTGTITSGYALGVVKLSANLSAANFATAVSDGGSGAGEFKINGVSIAFNAATDTVSDVLARINNSSAGVTASYDALNDRFLLTNKSTGDVGMALQDVTGNFLTATGLSAGTLARGKNCLFTVNNGDQLSSQSNTITEASSNITGLTVTALAEGTTTIDVASDTAKIKTAITDFIAEYNKAQSLIDTQTASTTDSKGKVTAGTLADENDADSVAIKLRNLLNATLESVTGSIKRLASLGIDSNGNDNTITLGDAETLDAALAANLNEIKHLFTNSDDGLAVELSAYLEDTVGDDGSLITRQDTLNKQISDIDTQISDLERLVQANKERMTTAFVAMEQAQARINQQLQFLSQRFGSTS